MKKRRMTKEQLREIIGREVRIFLGQQRNKEKEDKIREIIKKMIRRTIDEEDSEYQKKFRELMDKYGIKSPKELKGGDKEKEFWDEADRIKKTKKEYVIKRRKKK